MKERDELEERIKYFMTNFYKGKCRCSGAVVVRIATEARDDLMDQLDCDREDARLFLKTIFDMM